MKTEIEYTLWRIGKYGISSIAKSESLERIKSWYKECKEISPDAKFKLTKTETTTTITDELLE